MAYKFEKIAEQLPRTEDFSLKSQIIQAATSITLNIAEGSTSQSDAEQARFIGLAVRSLVETVACQHLINRRRYLKDTEPLRNAYRFSEKLFAKLQAFRTSLTTQSHFKVREEQVPFEDNGDTPF